MLRVLKDQKTVDESRKKLAELGCDTSRGWRRAMFAALYRLRFRTAPPTVAINKSWDVLTMLEMFEKHLPDRQSRLFDMGSFNCEIPLALWQRGYRRIRAADFNPLGRSINWYGNGIDFHAENFYQPDVPAESLDGITALSVIEHGYDGDNLMKSVSRILKPGGIFALSTDYHEEKLEIPSDYRIFGLPYMIFCRREIEELIEHGRRYGLAPLGDLQWSSSDYPIHFLGRDMTFLFLAFQKAK